MKVLYNWLKEFVDLQAPPADVRSRLSLSGTAVDAIDESPAGPVFDAEITINRPDCLGHYGIARELAALYRLKLKPIEPNLRESEPLASSVTRVDIECPELCARYTARVLRGVKVQPSPDWLKQRLEAAGQSSINNVVDITNYVMLELGQPLHAFDFDKLSGQRIVVRRARAGEKMRTLDGVERTLTPEMCVIADATHAVAIGGIMGGAESEIGFATRNILIESAWFDPISIRRASKSLGLRTEASTRFERGADPEMAELASSRVAELIQQLAGGELLAGIVDVYPRPEPSRKIGFTQKEFVRIMGAAVPARDAEQILSALGFEPFIAKTDGDAADRWECKQPSWRRDVSREIDLIEEVARIHGLDKFPPRLPAAKQPALRRAHAGAEERLRERLIALGYNETLAIPLVDPARDTLFRAEGISPAVIDNPLAQDASIMRTSGVLNMIQTLEWNLNRGQRNLRLFETGKRYEMRGGKPHETRILTLGATGLAREKSIYEGPREFVFADLKGDLDVLGEIAGGFEWKAADRSWLAPGRGALVSLNHGQNKTAGLMGQLASRIVEQFKLRQDAYVAEFDLDTLLEAIEIAQNSRRYEPAPRFPAVLRDFSLILSDGITFAQVAQTIRQLGVPELRGIRATDLYRGKNVPAGKYSLLVEVTFQSGEATLTDAQLAEFSANIVGALEKTLGATLRTF